LASGGDNQDYFILAFDILHHLKDDFDMMNLANTSSTRAVRVFEAFAAVGAPKSLSEIAELLETPLSTCHGLLRSLRDGGYLYVNGRTRQYYPTRRLLQVAETIAANDPVSKYFDVHMAELRDHTAETVILGVMEKQAVVYLSVLESRSTIRYSARPGDLKPLHSSALGKLVLGEVSERERDALIGALSFDAITENTLTDPAALRRDLAQSKARGLYVTLGENVFDVMAIAAPVTIGGQCYGLAVAGPLERVQRKRDAIEQALLETCAKIGREL
jgi:DNA-binding IclR family transcriptional regulator